MSVRNSGDGRLDRERESLLLSVILEGRDAGGITAPEAVIELLQGHRPDLERICWTRLRRHPGVVEDAMQDIALALLDALRQKRDKRQSIDDFGKYARTTAINTCMRYTTSARQAPVALDDVDTADPSGFDDLFRRVWNGRALALIDEAVDQLTPRTREIVRDLVLRELAGVPAKAGGTAASVYKARSRGLRHVIAALRVRLRGELDPGTACDALRELLDAAEDRRTENGQLSATSLEEIARHLHTCSRCKDQEDRRIFAALRALPFLLSPRAAERLDARIRLVSARTFASAASTHRQPRPRTRRRPSRARPSRRPVPRPRTPRPRRRDRGLTTLFVLLVLVGAGLALGRWSPAVREALPRLPALPGASPATEHERPLPQSGRPQAGRTPTPKHETTKAGPSRRPRTGDGQKGDDRPPKDPNGNDGQDPNNGQNPNDDQNPNNEQDPHNGQDPNGGQGQDGGDGPPAPRTLTINLDAGGGGDATRYLDITVAGTPAGTCDAPATCTFPVHDGDEVTYVHTPEPHENPAGDWTTGRCPGSAATVPCTFTIDGDVTLNLQLPWS
ncbi:sigma-70 family RNA polymerase sigma factor [Spirillospora sp. NPDC000708]